MPKLKTLMAAGVTALTRHISPFTAINLLVPREGYRIHRDLAYGADPRHKLDVYVPSGSTGLAPVVLFFYGGGWQGGDRSDYLAFGQAFASAGMVAVVADYRLYPQVKYPCFVEDAADALAFVRSHAARFGGDAGRIFLAGHSAGAYNAVMLASEPKFIAAKGGSLDWIRGVIGIAGPYNFLPMSDPVYVDMFHGTNNTDSMPVHHVDGPRPPMLLVSGSNDDTVSLCNTNDMSERLKRFGSDVHVIFYKGVGHVGVILALVRGFRGIAPLRRDMIDFVRAH
ncbi:MAG TPA: alpha/beta hydrolase [Rhizomicrobium sp.]|jgi:acetyl esterase/lipase